MSAGKSEGLRIRELEDRVSALERRLNFLLAPGVVYKATTSPEDLDCVSRMDEIGHLIPLPPEPKPTTAPENQDCKPERPMEYSPCQTCVHRRGSVVLRCAIRDADSFFRVFNGCETCSHHYSSTPAAPSAPDEKSCTPDLKPGDLKDDAQPTETYWKDLCAKLRRELNEAIEENEKLRDELLDALRELRRRVK